MLRKALKTYHDSMTLVGKKTDSDLCAECGTDIPSLANAEKKMINGKNFFFCSRGCSLNFEYTVDQVTRLVQYITAAAEQKQRDALKPDEDLVAEATVEARELGRRGNIDAELAEIVATAGKRESGQQAQGTGLFTIVP